MSKHRALTYGQPLPQDFLDALQELLGPSAQNLRITQLSNTAIQIIAGTGNDQVSAGISGLWRWITSTVTANHPGGASGQWDIFLVASANSFSAGVGNETDNTDYTFGLVIVAHNATPSGTFNGHAIAATRKIGEVTWSGSAITSVQNFLQQAIPALSITSSLIVDGTIVDADVAADTLTARVIAPGAVGASEIADGTITDTEIASANKDGVVGTASLRTLGTGAQQAAAGNDSRFTNARTPTAHASTHVGIGGTDLIDFTVVIGAGTLASRPAAASWNAGYLYLATDVNGGTMYRSNGAAWSQATLGVNLAGVIVASAASGSQAIADNQTNVDLTGASVSVPVNGNYLIEYGAARVGAGNQGTFVTVTLSGAAGQPLTGGGGLGGSGSATGTALVGPVALTAGATIKLQATTGANGGSTVYGAWVKITRVS